MIRLKEVVCIFVLVFSLTVTIAIPLNGKISEQSDPQVLNTDENQMHMIIQPMGDTYVDSEYHWKNKGNSYTLAVWNGYIKYVSFLKFDLNNLINSTVVSATLVLRVEEYSVSSNQTSILGTHLYNESWSEDELTWDTVSWSSLNETATDTTEIYLDLLEHQVWFNWTVTQDVQNLKGGFLTEVVRVENDVESIFFSSRETSCAPYLNVTYVEPPASNSWTWVRDTVSGAYGEAVVGTGDAIYVARKNDFYCYSPTYNTWTALADPPNPDSDDAFKTGTALAWDSDDYIYALYGAATADSRRWFYRYSISTNSWEPLANTTANQGEGDTITWVNTESCLYATIGGEQRSTHFMRYDPAVNSWNDTPADPPAGMGDGASLVWTGEDFMYALRGEYDEESPLCDFWRYSITGNVWIAMVDIPANNHGGGVGGVGDGGSLLYIGHWLLNQTDYIYALSGNQAYPENPVIPDNRTYRYTISNNSWQRLADLPFEIGYYVGCRLGYAYGHIYAWQGTPSTWTGRGDDLAKYDFPATTEGTFVGGVIWENTTWTLENSPYIITDTVQIPSNVTLIINPGVTVTRPTNGDMFLLHGIIYAHGTLENKVSFDGGGNSDFFNVRNSNETTFLDLDYCIIKNGNQFWDLDGGVGCGPFSLKHSELINLGESTLGTAYVWYPKGDVHIENNMFINTGGITTGISNEDVEVYIKYNLFKQTSSPIQNNRDYSEKAGTIVKYNSFVDIDGYVLALGCTGQPVNMSATENYWGTLNTNVIDSKIYDRNDNINCPVFIDYLPILTEPHSNTPALPLLVNFTYSPSTLYTYGTVVFNASASVGLYSIIANYTWDFGDDNTTMLETPATIHTYTMAGDYNVTLTVTDEFGFKNSTTTHITVLQDNTPPDTSDDYDGLWHTADFAITLTATDQESGVAETNYKVDDGSIRNVSVDGQPYITTESRNNTLEYWSVDNAGQEELPHKFLWNIKFDKTNPTIGVPSRMPGGDIEPEQPVAVSVNVTDARSRVKNVTLFYTTNNGTTWQNQPMNCNTSTSLYEATIPGQPAEKWVKYRIVAYDYAENNATRDGTEPYCSYYVIPEFPSLLILPLFMMTTLLAVIVYRRKVYID